MLKTKFRRTRCLCHVGEYDAIKDCVITEDGKKHIIQTMRDGTEYFTIDNPYNNNVMKRHFIGCIGDAIRAIREDYADVLLSSLLSWSHKNVFTKGDYPIVFLDRTKGEELRAKFKEGWKDAKFGWGIEYGGKNSFGGYHMVNEKGKAAIFGDNKVYSTEEEAKNQFKKWHNEALAFAKEFISVYHDEDKGEKIIQKVLYGNNGCNIVTDLFFDMLKDEDNTITLVDDIHNLPNIGWHIVQTIA